MLLSILERAREAASDPTLDEARRFKQDAPGRRTVGSFTPCFPVELTEALGILHVGLLGASGVRAAGCAVAPLCAAAESTLGQGMKGYLRSLDLIVVGQHCPASRNLSSLLRRYTVGSIHSLDLPFAGLPAPPIDRIESELQLLTRALEAVAGRKLTPLHLRAALHLRERQRALMREIFTVHGRRPEALSLVDAFALVRLGAVLPPRAHAEILEQVLPAILHRPAGVSSRPRVVLVGGALEAPPLGLLEAIERSGLQVVDHDLLWGQWSAPAPRPDGEPMRVLAEILAAAIEVAPWPLGASLAPGEDLCRRIKEARATAALLLRPLGCELTAGGEASIRGALEQHGIPYLDLPYDPGTVAGPALREQFLRLRQVAERAA